MDESENSITDLRVVEYEYSRSRGPNGVTVKATHTIQFKRGGEWFTVQVLQARDAEEYRALTGIVMVDYAIALSGSESE